MRRALPVLTHPLFLTLVLFILQLGLFLWITMRPYSIAPAGRAYYILHGQGAYTSYIRQSKDGAWKIANPNTTRKNPAIYIQLLYVFLGKIAGVFSVDPVTAYMISRVVAGFILFSATYWLISIVLPTKLQSLAVIFTLGLEPGPFIAEIKHVASLIKIHPAIFSYFPQEMALRHFGLPHHVLAEALGLLLLAQVFLFTNKSSWQRLGSIALLTVAGTLIMPAYTMVMVITVFAAWFMWAIIKGQAKKIIPALVIIVVCFAAAGLFTKAQMNAGDIWKYFSLDEKRWVPDGEININYLSSLALYLSAIVFLWINLHRAWRHMTASAQLLVVLFTTWVVGPPLYFPLTHLAIFPLANFRLVDGYAYVPAGILAAMGISEIARAGGRRIAMLFVVLTVAASLFLTASYVRKTFEDQQNIYTNVYLLYEEWDAIRYLSTVPKNSGIMVLKYLGDIIPVYGTVRVFLGETPGAIDWDDRYVEAVRFYSGQLTNTEAQDLLRHENISYIYWGWDEKQYRKTPTFYPDVLVPVFRNTMVTVFGIRQ